MVSKSIARKDLAKKILAKSYIWILLILMYLPVLILIICSFTTSVNLMDWSNGFSLDLYGSLFSSRSIWIAVGNTVLIALISAALATVLGTLGAIGVFESKQFSKKVMEFTTQIPVVNPEIVIAFSLIIMFVGVGAWLGFKTSFWTILAGHLVLTTPFVYLSVKPKLMQMDPEMYEAALDLGCKPRQALLKTTLPDILPGVFSGFLLAITLSLDDFIVTAFLKGPGLLSGRSDIETLSTYVEGIIKKHPMPAELRALTALIFLAVLVVVIAITVYNNVKANKTKKRKGREY